MTLLLLSLLITCQSQKKYENKEKKYILLENNDPHSFSNPQFVRVYNMHLDLNINWKNKTLEGKVGLKMIKSKDNDTLILDTRELVIEQVKDGDGKILEHWLGKTDSIFGTALYIPTKGKDSVIVHYKTVPGSEALQWLTPEQTNDKEEEFLYSQSQAILARSWVPCQDAPAVKFTYSAEIKTKKDFLALMSATNPKEINPDGYYTFEQDQPISSYLLAIASGKIAYRSLGPDCGIYAETGMLDKAAWEFADMQKMIDEAGKLYGKYMWKQYDVLVLPPSFPFGGMENPRLTFATPTVITGDRSQVALIAHELAHSWSGNLVTNSTWNDFWLNEGFTSYFEQRIMEKLYGKPYEQMRQVLAWNDLQNTIEEMNMDNLTEDTKLKLDLSGRDPDDGLTDVAYDKGRFFLCHLEDVVGRENWDEFLKNYFKSHAFGSMDTEGFLEYLNNELLNRNEQWKKAAQANAWIYGAGMPEGAKKPVSTELTRVDSLVEACFSKDLKPYEMDTTGFTTHHWQYFIRQFSKKAGSLQVIRMEKAFHFSLRSNSEINCDWFVTTIKAGLKINRIQIENFLTTVGRRKFLMPIYEELIKTKEGKEWARSVFEKAKSGYHSVSRNSVEHLLYRS
ncbi:MAG: M1 family metallopeptidase [Flavobacteriales bacterium]|nr:M1 family metallopeptidase [Flavobacteriales bacterium]